MEYEIDLRWYLSVLWRWAWLLILAAALAGAAAYVVSRATLPIYQSSTTIMISEAPGAQGSDYSQQLVNERLAQTYTGLLTTRPLLDKVIQQLGLQPMTSSALRSAISVRLARNTQLINLSVRDTDPHRAAKIANTLVEVFAVDQQQREALRYADSKERLQQQMAEVDQQITKTQADLDALGPNPDDPTRRDQLVQLLAQLRQSYNTLLVNYEQFRLAEGQNSSNIIQVDPAIASFGVISPRTRFNTTAAALIGLLVALGGVFLKEKLDDTIKDPQELTQQTGLPVLGMIANFGTNDALPIVVAQPRSPTAEAFRNLRTNIGFASVDRPLHTLLVTSPSPDEGKSTVISNLAAVLAQNNRRVALVEADLRRPTVHKKMALTNRVGITELFVQPEIEIDGMLQETPVPGLRVLTAGDLPPNPAELLGSEKMNEILSRVREHADVVLIDTPPVLAVTDAVVLSQRVDGVLLVVKAGSTKMGACKQAVDQLRLVGVTPLGIVMNGLQLRRSRYYYAYHGYYYSYGYDSDGDKSDRTPRRPRWNVGRKNTTAAKTS